MTMEWIQEQQAAHGPGPLPTSSAAAAKAVTGSRSARHRGLRGSTAARHSRPAAIRVEPEIGHRNAESCRPAGQAARWRPP